MLELAEKVITLTASESRIVFEALPANDPKQRRPDITRATELLGWAPAHRPRRRPAHAARALAPRRAPGPDGGRMKRLLTACLAALALAAVDRDRGLRRPGPARARGRCCSA